MASATAAAAVADKSGMLRWMKLCTALLLATALSAQIDPRAAILERDGWDALAAGHARDATDAFRQALAADPRNARLHLGAGMAATLDHRDADARESLERALLLDPKLNRARALLGQVLYRLGLVHDAIRTYETLIADGPDDSNARAALERWRREVELHDGMRQAVGSHFTVSFEGPAESALAALALESLDRAYWRIGQLLAVYPSDPIPVVLYTTSQFRDITRSPSWAAGAYDGTIRVPMRGALDDLAELDRVLAHEFTHALVRTLAPRGVPVWLNEGLASAIDTSDLAWAEGSLRKSLAVVPLRALTSGFGRLSGDEAELAYATSALAVRRLLRNAGGFAIANLLRDIGAGVDFDTAFLHRMQLAVDDFQKTLSLY
jgi:tetratricopeptide (TPR) repeat protein